MPDTASWTTPECPFAIDYSPSALEQIRMAVSDAFYSLPRGGAEIGGILLGAWTGGRLTISGFRQLDCEHAFGPSFSLSPRDRLKLGKLIAAEQASGAQVVGWYHSHTRSEIFLSPADLEIYRDFFPEAWQVALVLRPHTLLPTSAGFFFRDAEGSVRSEMPYKELTLDPLEAKPAEAAPPEPSANGTHTPNPPFPLSASTPVADPPLPAPIPRFLERESPAPRTWPKIVVPLLIGAAIGAPAYWKRDLWIPRLLAIFAPAQTVAAQAPALGLRIVALDGQLEIHWDRNSPAVAGSEGGVLRVTGVDPSMEEIWLDRQHLLSGVFTVAGSSERVDVSLALNEPVGRPVSEATSFIGKLPQSIGENGSGADEIAKLRADLDGEIQRNRKLQLDVDFLAKEWRDQRALLAKQGK
jgi:hypothetical protein